MEATQKVSSSTLKALLDSVVQIRTIQLSLIDSIVADPLRENRHIAPLSTMSVSTPMLAPALSPALFDQ
jgi:hypothetical protein